MRRWESFHVHQNHFPDSHLTEIKCCASTKRARALHCPTPCLLKSLFSLAQWFSPSPAKFDPSLLSFFLLAHDQWRNCARCLSHAVMKRKERKQKKILSWMKDGQKQERLYWIYCRLDCWCMLAHDEGLHFLGHTGCCCEVVSVRCLCLLLYVYINGGEYNVMLT